MSAHHAASRLLARIRRRHAARNLGKALVAKIRSLGTILVVGAHPDDEAFMSAGLMAAARRLGLDVRCLTATCGEAGSRDEDRWPEATIAATRRSELLASLKSIGISPNSHRFLGYIDGECYLENEEEAVEKILAELIRVMPDTVITFGPDGFTGHTDHQEVSRWAALAFRIYQDKHAPHAQLLYYASTQQWQQDCRPLLDRAKAMYGAQYPTITPESELYLNLTLTGLLLKLKLKAVMAHFSQITPLMDAVGGMKPLLAWFAHETFLRAIPPSSTHRSSPSADWDSRELFSPAEGR